MHDLSPLALLPATAKTTQSAVAAVSHVCKTFGPVRALHDVVIAFHAGQVHCLLGENGAGKSTIGKLLGGLYRPDSGEVLIDGAPVRLRNIADARKHGIAVVFQELSAVPHLTVRENLCLGTEQGRQPFARLRRGDEVAHCRAVFANVGVDFPLEAPVGSLSVADQQMLEVVKAIARRPRLLILDEPTAMLGVAERDVLLEIIRSVKAQGTAIVFVTHHVEEVLAVADTVSLMKDGQLVRTFDITPDVTATRIVEALSGGQSVTTPDRRQTDNFGSVLVRFQGLRARKGRQASISVREGEIVGLYGVVGCGREKMALALVGLDDMGDGAIIFKGKPHRPRSPAAAARVGISYLPSGRVANCILPNRNIRENLMLTQLGDHQRGGFLRRIAETSSVASQLTRLRARYGHDEDLITSLSGGNQQKVMLGRCLARKSSLLVLEDPTAGVDIHAKADIHELIRERSAAGAGVVLVSSDLLETIRLSDVIYTVMDGEIIDEYRHPVAADEPAIIADVLGQNALA